MEIKEVQSIPVEVEDKGSSIKRFGYFNIIIGVIVLIIGLAFFGILSVITGNNLSPGEENLNPFGLGEMLFSLVVAAFAAGFFAWLQTFMKKQPYVGLIIGVLTLGAFEDSLYLKYAGFYTNIFALVIALVVLAFLGLYFYQGKKEYLKKTGVSEFDD